MKKSKKHINCVLQQFQQQQKITGKQCNGKPINVYNCDICEKTFDNKNSLRGHTHIIDYGKNKEKNNKLTNLKSKQNTN